MAGIQKETEIEETTGELGNEDLEIKEDIETNDNEDPYKNETAAETTRRVYEELQRAGEKDEEEAHPTNKDDNKPVKETKAKKVKEDEFDPELSPPERLKVHEKEMFNNLPKGLKRAYHRSIKDLESMTGKTQDEASKLAQKYKEIEAVVEPLAVDWGELGLSPAQGMRELVSAQKKLTDPKPAVREAAFRRMAQGCGLGHILRSSEDGQYQPVNQAPDISAHPEVVALKNEILQLRQNLNPIASNYQQQIDRQNQEMADSNTASMKAVRDEIDPRTGKYLRPELHDDGFINRVGPLVKALMEAVPGRTAGEALAIAHSQVTGNLYQTPQAKPLASSNSNIINQRAAQAAVSVRGKAAPSVSPESLGEPPASALKTPRDTAQWAYEKLARGY